MQFCVYHPPIFLEAGLPGGEEGSTSTAAMSPLCFTIGPPLKKKTSPFSAYGGVFFLYKIYSRLYSVIALKISPTLQAWA